MIDAGSGEKLYVQLQNILKQKIKSREWIPGEKLPGEMELAKTYSLSRSTVRQALDGLEREGLISKHQGKGSVVRLPKLEQRLGRFYSFSEEIFTMGRRPSAKVLNFSIVPADTFLAGCLRLSVGDHVYCIKRLRFADQDPFAVETSYVPFALFPGMTQEKISEQGLYAQMRQSSGFAPNRATESFEAVLLTGETARLLGAERPAAGLYLERLTYSDETAVELCKTIIRGDCYKYHVLLN